MKGLRELCSQKFNRNPVRLKIWYLVYVNVSFLPQHMAMTGIWLSFKKNPKVWRVEIFSSDQMNTVQ